MRKIMGSVTLSKWDTEEQHRAELVISHQSILHQGTKVNKGSAYKFAKDIVIDAPDMLLGWVYANTRRVTFCSGF